MRFQMILGVGILVFFTLLSFSSVRAGQVLEDFTTTTFEDPATTAAWDTTTGTLHLPFLNLRDTGIWSTPSAVQGVAVDEDNLYVAAGSSGLLIFNRSNPGGAAIGSYVPPSPNVRDVALYGYLAVLANGAGGLYIANIINPAAPFVVGSTGAEDNLRSVVVDGRYAYAADATENLSIYDISNPAVPARVNPTSHYDDGDSNAVAVSGNYAYVANGPEGVVVMRIRRPADSVVDPAFVTKFASTGTANDVFVDGDYLYVADSVEGLKILDITNPAAPSALGSYALGEAMSVVVSGNEAFVADLSGDLEVIDVSNPSAPVWIGRGPTDGEPKDVALLGNTVYVADGTEGVMEIRVRAPGTPHILWSLNISDAEDVAKVGNHLFIAEDNGIHVYDVSNPAAPVALQTYLFGNSFDNLAPSGNYLFASNSTTQELVAFDISNPDLPVIEDTFSVSPNYIYDIAVHGDRVYTAQNSTGSYRICVYEFRHTTSPSIQLLNCASPSGVTNIQAVAVDGEHLYAGTIANGTRAYTLNGLMLADPPAVWTNLNYYEVNDITIADNRMYLARDDRLTILNISNPTFPTEVGSFWESGVNFADVAVQGERAYLVGFDYLGTPEFQFGFLTLDISDPTTPTLIDRFHTNNISGIDLAGGIAYFASDESGVFSVAVSHPRFDARKDFAQSLTMATPTQPVPKLRVEVATDDSVSVEVSADGGNTWNPAPNGGAGAWMSQPGTDPMWRATLYPTELGVNPTIDSLLFQWLYAEPQILKFVDEPNDQGGYVRVVCEASAFDDLSLPISDDEIANYYLWRRIDDPEMIAEIPSLESTTPLPLMGKELEHFEFQGRKFLHMTQTNGTFPPGLWEIVGSAPGMEAGEYRMFAPTWGDSTDTGITWTTFCVSAHDRGGNYYVSAQDSTYSVDNIFPSAPTGFQVAYWSGGSGNDLGWDQSIDDDFHYFKVYRGLTADFPVDPSHIVHQTIETDWLDAAGTTGHHYKVSTVDDAGNESPAVAPQSVTGVPTLPLNGYALDVAFPNPLYTASSIRFRVPTGGGTVRLELYDIRGGLVKRLVNGYQPEGEREVIWSRIDQIGRKVPAGAYFYRLQAKDFTQTRKLIVLD